LNIRKNIKTALVSIDRQLGVRDWLRDEGVKEQAYNPINRDPFGGGDINHPPPRTVLDIGGSHGQFAKEVFRAFPHAKIYSFEPIPECYQELEALRDGIPNLHPIKIALSDHAGERELRLSRFRDSSSLHEMLPAHLEAWPYTEIESKIKVNLACLDDIAPGLELKKPVLAKIDVQGHELAVMHGGRATLSICQRVMLECNFAPLYDGQPSFVQLYNEMKSIGFLLDAFITPLRHPQTHELLSADVVFYRLPS
jgi:FkbM family methyltransferase